MGRKSLAAERRAEILDAYEECILERGFSETTLGDVAERARCKRPLIRHYFGNRSAVVRDLFARLATRYDDRFESRIVGTTTAEILESFLQSIAGSVHDPDEGRDDQIFGELFGAALTDGSLKSEVQRTTQRWLGEYTEFLRWLAPDAATREVEETAKLCLGVSFGVGTLRTLGAVDDDPKWVCNALRHAIERLRSGTDPTETEPPTTRRRSHALQST